MSNLKKHHFKLMFKSKKVVITANSELVLQTNDEKFKMKKEEMKKVKYSKFKNIKIGDLKFTLKLKEAKLERKIENSTSELDKISRKE